MALRVFLGMCTVSFAIAAYWAWKGLWMVLPFAGLEMLCLGVGLTWALHHNRYREVLQITDGTMIIQRGYGLPQKQDALPLHWIRLHVVKPKRVGQPHRIQLRCSDRWIEIGRVLTDAERLALADRLEGWLREERFAAAA